ncbi:MAG: cobalamin-dependent protein [Deltaproteobacteria bacterium]|nr:cobalamin-dependent protein [Deltaproteobacteria bacterium]
MKESDKKLNYLLVMPRLIQTAGDGYSFPLGIAYISSSMKKAGHRVTTLNLNHCDGEVQDLLRSVIERDKIDVVATGGLSFQYNTVKRVVEAAKKTALGTITIVGGGLITGDPEPAMGALEYADYGVIGEGEITMNELCSTLESGGDISRVNGIIYKQDDRFVRTQPRREMDDIDSLPWPDYAGFDLDAYLSSTPPGISGLNESNTVFMLASRSCPYNCTFCFHTTGRRYRQRSLDAFFEELDYLVARHKIGFICLADELFARNPQRVREFCSRIKTYGLRWWAQFRVDDITDEILPILKDGGCEIMSFGLESADNRILKSMRKGTTVEQIERTLKLVFDAGISLEGAFIFGDIEETWETASNTLRWWREHAQYRISLNLITVYPGSYLYQYACEKGIIRDREQFLKEGCPQINVSKLTDGELSLLIRTIMEAPMTLTKTLASVVVRGVDPNAGRVHLTGVCLSCGERNDWDHVKLFATNFIPCKKCGQKYNIPLSSELRENIDENMRRLLLRHGKVAVWGINLHTSDLFRNSDVLKGEQVYPVDISSTKRKMDLYGKRIHAPEVIEAEGIEAVVVAIPVYLTQIASQIEAYHKGVTAVIDICHLTGPAYGL